LAQSEESVQRFKAKYRLSESTAIFVGALDESKRVRPLLDAASDVARRDSDFRLLIIGDGPLRDVVARQSLKSPCVVPVGPLRGADLALALKSAQILAIPGLVGLVAADSFGTERPIVTLQSSRHAPEFDYLVLGSPHLLRELQAGCRASAPDDSVEEMSERFINGLIQLVKGVDE
jgi:glycosyltransferase involved in cell wall biosynthesis